jgi:5-bromo-4-chloroindolyl phosphate hydrolysis protein
VEQDERAIEMTKAQFRQIRQDLRDAKDKAIEKNANYLIEKRLQIIKEKTRDLQTV